MKSFESRPTNVFRVKEDVRPNPLKLEHNFLINNIGSV